MSNGEQASLANEREKNDFRRWILLERMKFDSFTSLTYVRYIQNNGSDVPLFEITSFLGISGRILASLKFEQWPIRTSEIRNESSEIFNLFKG